MDCESGDMLKILGGTLMLTIKGGGNVIFKGVDTATIFNINGDIYGISGKSLTN